MDKGEDMLLKKGQKDYILTEASNGGRHLHAPWDFVVKNVINAHTKKPEVTPSKDLRPGAETKRHGAGRNLISHSSIWMWI